MSANRLLLLFALTLLVAGVGCGSSGTTPPPPVLSQSEFLYTTSFQPPSGESKLLAFKFDVETGTLTSPTSIALPLTFGIAVDPASKFLYASDPDFSAPAIDIFTIDPKTGVLTADGAFLLGNIGPFPPPGSLPSGPGALAMDLKGKFLFYGSATFGGGIAQGIGALAITDGSGRLNAAPGSPFSADDVPYEVTVHPSGRFLFTGNIPDPPAATLQGISGFSVDPSTGILAAVPGSPFTPPVAAGLGGLAFHPSGRFLYVSSGTAANGVLGWSVDSATGVITPLPGSPFAAGTTAAGVAIDPMGRFLYASNGVNGGMLGFSIDSGNGTLTPLAGSPFGVATITGGQMVDPSGKFLVAVDPKQQAIVLFSINSSTGALTPFGNPTPIGGIAFSMVIAKAP